MNRDLHRRLATLEHQLRPDPRHTDPEYMALRQSLVRDYGEEFIATFERILDSLSLEQHEILGADRALFPTRMQAHWDAWMARNEAR